MTTLAAPRQYLPRLLPGALTVLLGGTLLCATLARLEHGAGPGAAAAPATIRQTTLTFADASDGAVRVTNANGGMVARIPARSGGFLRMVLRLLASARARRNIGAAAPFLLTEQAGDHLLLSDPATGERIELEAFGPSNVAEFAALLEPAK